MAVKVVNLRIQYFCSEAGSGRHPIVFFTFCYYDNGSIQIVYFTLLGVCTLTLTTLLAICNKMSIPTPLDMAIGLQCTRYYNKKNPFRIIQTLNTAFDKLRNYLLSKTSFFLHEVLLG